MKNHDEDRVVHILLAMLCISSAFFSLHESSLHDLSVCKILTAGTVQSIYLH